MNTNFLTFADRDIAIKEQIRKDKNIVYGGKAMNKNISFGILRRPTLDFDVVSKKPLESARKLEKKLDKKAGANIYYTKPAKYEHTVKVMSKGRNLKNPDDDYGVADFTSPQRKMNTVNKNGIRYARLEERESDARRSLTKQEFVYRHDKDREDLNRIRMDRRLR